MRKPRHESYPRARDRSNDHDPHYFRGRRTAPNIQSLVRDAESEPGPINLPEPEERAFDPNDWTTSSQATNPSQRSPVEEKKKLPTSPAQPDPDTASENSAAPSSPASSKVKENLKQKDNMGSSEESLDENQNPTIGGRKLLEAPALEGPIVPKKAQEPTITSPIPAPAPVPARVTVRTTAPQAPARPPRPLTPLVTSRPPPQRIQLKPLPKSPSQESLLSCEREYLANIKKDPKATTKKSSYQEPAAWGQGAPRHNSPPSVPDEGIKIPYPENPPFEFTLPICEAWLQYLTDANIRFPFGRIIHPDSTTSEFSASDSPFDLIIKISIPSDKFYVFHCHDLIELATIWLKEFQKVQNKYLPHLQSMNALNPGNFTGSRPIFYGVHGPTTTEGKQDFIPPYVRGVWTDEKVEYNRAAFLTKMLEECPSTKGQVNLAAMICLMALSSQNEITVITSLDDLVAKTRESLFIKESWIGRCLSDSGYSRLIKMTDDFFKFVYMRFRRLHKISPMYEYTSFENRHEGLRPLAAATLRRDAKEDVLGRRTPIHWKKMFSTEYFQLLRHCIIEGELNDARRDHIRQSTLSEESWSSTASTKVHHIELSCCTIFPMGKVDITKELHDDYPHEDQLLWFLLTLYHPELHSTLTTHIATPQNAILTTPGITSAIHDLKLWLDPYIDSDDEDESSQPPHKNPQFEKIFKPNYKPQPPFPPPVSQTDATYKVFCQCFESHIAEGCFPVPTYGWEMYPHLAYIKAREGIPLPSPEIISLHRAISIAATESGAWGAGDGIFAAEEKEWCPVCKTDKPHYCLFNSPEFPEKKSE
ncbi:hypothetical protein TWF718_000525 [Orbilia javanica]|uniref:Uncharacterized protein n=1 Tax=Orbilia javanica TaxID=47235 RepID=A0AAN8MX96_9PEZI